MSNSEPHLSERGSDFRAWIRRRARTPNFLERLLLIGLISAGSVAVLRFFDFWFRSEHVGSPTTFVLLSLALWYGISRIVLNWVAALAIHAPKDVPPNPGYSVAIFTTSSPGEPLSMFERTLAACRRVRYPHTTYLLDDTQDPAFAELARRHGAVHLPLVGLPGAKAGKINAALSKTREEFILVLDPDHVPLSEFLDRVLGHFQDGRVGFVQVAQAYYNQSRSPVARGAAEQTYAFYGPTEMGLCGLGSVLAIGANCTFRRSALESIGGHGIGLAEDLVTAVRLHAAGWRGVYVPEIVSRGLVPEDLRGFYQQQLKWARGVYEVLFMDVFGRFRRLTGLQRLALTTVGTYYLVGLTTLVYLLIPHLAIWFDLYPTRMSLSEFVLAGFPVAAFGVIIHCVVQRYYCYPRAESALALRGLALKVACWPVYCRGLLLALLDRFVRYVPTAKRRRSSSFLPLAAPHLVTVGSFLVAAVEVGRRTLHGHPDWASSVAMLAFSFLSSALSFPALAWAWQARESARANVEGDAWDQVPRWITD